MKLTAQTVSPHLTDYAQIKHLYHTAFPEDELFKWSWLMFKAHSSKVEFLAYYDQNQFVGLSYTIHYAGIDLLLYLAVDPQYHSQGYGGQILDWLIAKHPDTPLVLEVEPLDEDAPNITQRKRRVAFYQRHGFHNTHHRLVEDRMEYSILTNHEKLDLRNLHQLYRWFARPFSWRSKVTIQ